MPAIIALIVLVAIFVVPKLVQNGRDQSLKEQVAWTTTTSSEWDSPRALELWQYIHNFQNRYSVEDKYRISTKDEWDIAKSLIEKCRSDLAADFSQNRVQSTKYTADLTPEEYFVFSLSYFLSENQTKTVFLGQIMYIEIDRVSYSAWSYDATYSITDFGMVFHKLRYITSLYCLDHPRIKSMIGYMNPTDQKKTLDTGIYKISVMST